MLQRQKLSQCHNIDSGTFKNVFFVSFVIYFGQSTIWPISQSVGWPFGHLLIFYCPRNSPLRNLTRENTFHGKERFLGQNWTNDLLGEEDDTDVTPPVAVGSLLEGKPVASIVSLITYVYSLYLMHVYCLLIVSSVKISASG